MKIDLPVLKFVDDGIYLDDRKIENIVDFQIRVDFELGNIAELDVDIAIVDEYGESDYENINKYVVVKGLNGQTENLKQDKGINYIELVENAQKNNVLDGNTVFTNDFVEGVTKKVNNRIDVNSSEIIQIKESLTRLTQAITDNL